MSTETGLMTGTHMQGQTAEAEETKTQTPGNYMADIDHIVEVKEYYSQMGVVQSCAEYMRVCMRVHVWVHIYIEYTTTEISLISAH